MTDIWFTSDTHYDHVNMIKYCRRPFLVDLRLGWQDDNLDVHAMNETMVERWNERVRPDDVVYHLGDVMLGPGATLRERLKALRGRLNGRIHLVLGNHDRGPAAYLEAGFDSVRRAVTAEFDDVHVRMRHRPPRTAQAEDAGFDLILTGHVHERWLHKGKVVNVGVDQWGFYPVNLETLLAVNQPGCKCDRCVAGCDRDSLI